MKSVDILLQEHRAIEAMLGVLDAAAARLHAGNDVPIAMLEQVLDFFRDFADRCHHAKEEQSFFPALETHGAAPNAEPLESLLAQHEEGRSAVRAMRDALDRLRQGDATAGEPWAAAADKYSGLLRDHIRLEDEFFQGFAAAVLSPAEDDSLVRRFDEVERGGAGAGHDHYHGMIARYQEVISRW
jgi:hemerythrin-like domain-containing protein